MSHAKLTQKAAEQIQPGTKDFVTWDELAGLGLRCSPAGVKTFFVQYRYRDAATGRLKERQQTLGRLSFMSVDAARKAAKVIKLQVAQGVDPLAERHALKVKQEATEFTLAKLVNRYLSEYVALNNRNGGPKAKAYLLGRWVKVYGSKPAHQLTEADVRAFKAKMTAVNQANHLIAVLRHMYDWAVDEKLVPANPAAAVKKTKLLRSDRDRVLSHDEIRSFWAATDQLGWPVGPLFKLLLLTGQREAEIGHLRWSEINETARTINLPGSRTKNGKPHVVHLSDLAMSIIAKLPQINGSAYVFTGDGSVPFANYTYARKRASRLMGVYDFTVHDLRRTATTLMCEIGVAPHVADRVLNHVNGSTISGVAAVYNRFQYLDERRDALDRLGRFIAQLVGDNVVELPLAAE